MKHTFSLSNSIEALPPADGAKRTMTGVLEVILQFIQGLPFMAPYTGVLQILISLFGGVAIGHAALKGSVTSYIVPTIAALLSILIGASSMFPVLLPFVPLMQKLVLVFGSLGVGLRVAAK